MGVEYRKRRKAEHFKPIHSFRKSEVSIVASSNKRLQSAVYIESREVV